MNAMTTISRPARMLGVDEELALYHRHMAGDGKATRLLVDAHMPLLNKMAGRYSRFGVNHGDLVQEATLGFIQGVNHFDPERGFRLNTLCRWWVKAAITEWVRVNHSLVRIGTTAAQKKLFGSLRESMTRLGIYPENGLTSLQLAALEKDLGVPAREISEMATRISSVAETSLDTPIAGADGNSGMTRVDQLSDERAMPIVFEDAYDDERRRDALHAVLGILTPRKRDIIQRRYLADEVETLEALSETHGVSRERVRQLEVQAIEELGLALPAALSQMAGQERRSGARGYSQAAR